MNSDIVPHEFPARPSGLVFRLCAQVTDEGETGEFVRGSGAEWGGPLGGAGEDGGRRGIGCAEHRTEGVEACHCVFVLSVEGVLREETRIWL